MKRRSQPLGRGAVPRVAVAAVALSIAAWALLATVAGSEARPPAPMRRGAAVGSVDSVDSLEAVVPPGAGSSGTAVLVVDPAAVPPTGAVGSGMASEGEGQSQPGAGQRVFRDPITGELTSDPTAEQRRRLLERDQVPRRRSTTGLRPFDLARGGQGVNLQGRFLSDLVVERGSDGRYRVSCSHPEHAAGPSDHGSPATSHPSFRPPLGDGAPLR